MFELHVVVASIVIFNILELIMEIMPNYPTIDNYDNFLIMNFRSHGRIRKASIKFLIADGLFSLAV
jgi:hypothetical protein